MFWWYLGTCSDQKVVDLSFVGFVELYLCFSSTWVHVVVEMNFDRASPRPAGVVQIGIWFALVSQICNYVVKMQ